MLCADCLSALYYYTPTQILKESVRTNVTREILGYSGIDQGVFKQMHKHR
jgi:hypothetical protein